MAYTIQYGPEGKAELKWKHGAGIKKRRIWAPIIVGSLLVLAALLGKGQVLDDFLIPGDPNITRAAFAQLTQDLREGDSVKGAMTAFCREIIDSAMVPG